jgi:hypothetical protein
MRMAAGIAALAVMAAGCEAKPVAEGDAAAPPAVAEAPAPVVGAQLTPEETAAGWKLLFNGTDLSGWKGYKKDAPGAGWAVEDGVLTLTAGGAGDIMTEEEFGPFELSLQWKISPNGNSGIIYLIKEDPAAENTYNTGPEMQVLDNDGHADGKFPTHRAGALYDFQVPPDGAVKPVGDWNEAVVRFSGSEIEHWLNGCSCPRPAMATMRGKPRSRQPSSSSGHCSARLRAGISRCRTMAIASGIATSRSGRSSRDAGPRGCYPAVLSH